MFITVCNNFDYFKVYVASLF